MWGKERILPSLTIQRESMPAFYERQINGLREQLNDAEVEIDTHLDALEVSEGWSKEKIGRIKELEKEVTKLTEENKKLKELTPQELVNKLAAYEAEVERLKSQLEQFTSQQVAQIEQSEVKKRLSWLSLGKKQLINK